MADSSERPKQEWDDDTEFDDYSDLRPDEELDFNKEKPYERFGDSDDDEY